MSKKLQLALTLFSLVLMAVSVYQTFTGLGDGTETGQTALLFLIFGKMDN